MVSPSPENDFVEVFEYPTFKVPYEELNQTFRSANKDIEKGAALLRKAVMQMQTNFPEVGNDAISIEPVRSDFLTAMKWWRSLDEAVRNGVAGERAILETLRKRIVHLEKEIATSGTDLDRWNRERDRTCRLTIAYLLRCGRIDTAKAIAEKAGLEDITDVGVFDRAREVSEALLERNTGPCLEWIHDHRSKLRKLDSKLELMVRLQDVVLLLQAKKRFEALQYARKHLALRDIKMDDNPDIKDVIKVWALLGVNVSTAIEPYARLLRPDRWQRVTDMFKEEFGRLYNLPYQSAFSMCIQCGLAAFKTPQCTPGGNEKCVTCNPTAYLLADGLPHAHTGQSVIRCAYSGEVLNEDNPPWMILKTGRVYGERSLPRLIHGDRIHCVKTGEWVSRKECVRIYIL